MLASIVINVLIFSALSVYNWLVGGTEGKIFAAVTICCSLISNTVTLYARKPYLYASVIPHALYLLSLPLISLAIYLMPELHGSAPQGSPLPMAVVTVSLITYLIYMAVAVRKLNGTMAALEQARDEAQAARKAAEDANAAKSNFLAVITHEIRTPMNAVVSSVNLLKATPLDSAQRAHLSMLSHASEVLLGLLNDVLDLSKIESGKMSFERANVDLNDLLRNMSALFQPQITDKGLSLDIEVAADVGALIVSDPLRLRQILFNLVSNAVKFTASGKISVRVGRLADGGSERLSLQVQDEGIGIAPELHERIFSNFEQAEATTTRRFGGTGLGLAISRRLARFMGGDITVISEPGRGACFCLTLPYEAALETLAPDIKVIGPPLTEPVGDGDGLHVLIVDDHEVNRRIVSLFIEPLGWTHEMAENGAEAVEICRQSRFDAILMDMQMPVMDGVTATREIRRQDGENRDTPIIALTANAMDFHIRAWAEVGVHDVLTKPLEPNLMIRTVHARALASFAGDDQDVVMGTA